MEIKYKNTIDDIVEMNLYYRKTIPKLRQIDLIINLILFALFVALGSYIIIVEKNTLGAIAMFTLGLLILKFGNILTRIIVKGSIAKGARGSNSNILDEKTLIVDDQGITIIRDSYKGLILWNEVEKIGNVEKYIFIFGKSASLSIPLNIFKSATDEMKFMYYIKRNVSESNIKVHY